MDGIHDLGGMDGFGPIDHTPEEPTFHEDWEGVVHAMNLLMLAHGRYTGFRHAIERMEPGWYLTSRYYEHWLAAIEKLLVEGDILQADILADRAAEFAAEDASVPERADAELAEVARMVVDIGGDPTRSATDPAFEVGDWVRVRNRHPRGHTRCPGYARNARGTVEVHCGTHVLPDTNAHGDGEQPEPLYNVAFAGEELWGNAAEAGTTVRIDLWERYLEAV